MKHSKKKATVKGMTLIEIMIAIFVLGIAGVLMCQIGSTVTKLLINANHIDKKTEVEAPVAVTQDSVASQKQRTVGTVDIPVPAMEAQNEGFQIPKYNIKRNVEKYSTAALADEAEQKGSLTDTAPMDGDLVFYVVKYN